MSSISVSSLVLGSLSVEVEGSNSTLALSVLATAPAVLSVELGTPGAQGPAATIAVGTTTTLSPGAAATVVNAGTSSAAVFNFGIPAGLKGDTGNTGATGAAATIAVGSTSTGAAGSSASVVNSGTSSAAVFDFTIPRGDKGDKGDTGNTGATGSQGPAGTAATATAGTTTTGAPGTSASVVNVGTTSAAVFNFTIPRGDVGATGATGATGAPGVGVPVGGTAGQSLLKVDGTDYNTTWGTPPLATLATSAETVIATVRNNTGATLTAGQVVYISGAAGNRAAVALAQANLEATSSGTYGMVSAPIPNNSDGTIVIAGFVANLNTSAFTDGDLLYLSPTTAGGFTSTKPTAPDNLVYIGVVARAHPNQGVIQLRISNGFELDELHDVSVPTPSNNDLLTWESSTALWKNKSAATLGLATTSASNAAYLAKASNLSDLGNAGTARSNLGLGTAAVEPATKLVPAGGTTGQVLGKLSNADWDDGWVTISSGGSTATIYTTPGTYTYTIPAGATSLLVYAWGAGGGGGAGARNATNAIRTGGGGGGPGGYAEFHLRTASLGASIQVVVAAGGTGGTLNTTNASVGQDGNRTITRTMVAGLAVVNGGGGTGGRTAATSANGGPAGVITNYINQVANNPGGAGSTTVGNSSGTISSWALPWPAGGGGGGGAAANFTTTQNGGQGGQRVSANTNGSNGNDTLIAGGAGGIQGVSPPTNGQTYTTMYGGMGGGGGGYLTNASGQNGAAGGQPGGGGGGGGAADNGFNGGAGGNGGAGMVIIFAV